MTQEERDAEMFRTALTKIIARDDIVSRGYCALSALYLVILVTAETSTTALVSTGFLAFLASGTARRTRRAIASQRLLDLMIPERAARIMARWS